MKKQIISLLTIIFSLITLNIYASEQNWKPAQDGDKIILIRLIDVSLLSLNSIGPTNETFFSVRNFKEFGFGVCCVCINIELI